MSGALSFFTECVEFVTRLFASNSIADGGDSFSSTAIPVRASDSFSRAPNDTLRKPSVVTPDSAMYERAKLWRELLGYPSSISLNAPESGRIALYATFNDPMFGAVTVGFCDAQWSMDNPILEALLDVFHIGFPPISEARDLRMTLSYSKYGYKMVFGDDSEHGLGDWRSKFTSRCSCAHAAGHACTLAAPLEIIAELTLRELGAFTKAAAVRSYGVFAHGERANEWFELLGYPQLIKFVAPPGIGGCQLFMGFSDPELGLVSIEVPEARWDKLARHRRVLLDDERFVRLVALMKIFRVNLPQGRLPFSGNPSVILWRVRTIEEVPSFESVRNGGGKYEASCEC